jgi:RNase P/RNase MRP subunit POP5
MRSAATIFVECITSTNRTRNVAVGTVRKWEDRSPACRTCQRSPTRHVRRQLQLVAQSPERGDYVHILKRRGTARRCLLAANLWTKYANDRPRQPVPITQTSHSA